MTGDVGSGYRAVMTDAVRITMTDPEGDLELDRSGSGWVRYRAAHLDGAEVRLRLGRDAEQDAAEVKDVWVRRPDRVSARLLREIPLGRIEATLQAPSTWQKVANLLPDTDTAETPFPEDEWKSRPKSKPLLPSQWFDAAGAWKNFILAEGTPKEDRLAVVHFWYITAKASSRRPAMDLSRVWNDIPTSTIHWWVKEARRLNLDDQARLMKFANGKPIDLGAGPGASESE